MHMTLGNMGVLENRIASDFVKPDLQNLIRLWEILRSLKTELHITGITKPHMTLRSHDITPNLSSLRHSESIKPLSLRIYQTDVIQ